MAFDPPLPPRESALRTAATVALLMLAAPVAWVVSRALIPLAPFLLLVRRRPVDPHPIRVPADLGDSGPPRLTAGGEVICTGCGAGVPLAAIAVDGRGYFCPACARRAD